MSFNKNDFAVDLAIGGRQAKIFSLEKLKERFPHIERIPFSVKTLLEQALRHHDEFKVLEEDIRNLSNWNGDAIPEKEIAFMPSRVVLQDFTGVPALVDLASLRSRMKALKKDPQKINPQVPVDLVIDHSVQVDRYGDADALANNAAIEFKRNKERYEFIKWGQQAFRNFKVYPPGAGIVHQVNLEHIANVLQFRDGLAFPDTVVGTDSHTTMINGIGVLGWGVGGIEAESVMLNQPIFMKIPEVIGFRLTGTLSPGVTATDLVLRVTEMLRRKGVVEKFVEFFGTGLGSLSVADRATIANMAPEYGSTVGFFPIDGETLGYLEHTGRDDNLISAVETYAKAQGIFRDDSTPDPVFTDVLELDLGTVSASVAGPKRPQDRIELSSLSSKWKELRTFPAEQGGLGLQEERLADASPVEGLGESIGHGSIVIAAITSCTNTSNPSVMLGAGILAKKADELGLRAKPWVKTSLAPGSRVVTDYLEKTGLQSSLEALGFHTVGYGCTTCIGNSGPLDENVSQAIKSKNLVAVSVLSGNRNFEGRVHGEVKANFLASPPLVVAYAICGRIDVDFGEEPLGTDRNGNPVFLRDIWPSAEEIKTERDKITPDLYRNRYATAAKVSTNWNLIKAESANDYDWKEVSTYIQNPPFFAGVGEKERSVQPIEGARVLLKLGDSVTTDHISPAGSFDETTPAGSYLLEKGVAKSDFNSYGSRRGNDRIMTRGTFANIRIRNQIAPGTEGGFTKHFPDGEVMTVFEASRKYQTENVPLVVLAGAEYGTGSSRDWAAKGTFLLGVKAVVAKSFERIHRSNLIGMGVLPLQFMPGEGHEVLGLTGEETFSVKGLNESLQPSSRLKVFADGGEFEVLCRLDTPVELKYYRNGGILHAVLRDFLTAA